MIYCHIECCSRRREKSRALDIDPFQLILDYVERIRSCYPSDDRNSEGIGLSGGDVKESRGEKGKGVVGKLWPYLAVIKGKHPLNREFLAIRQAGDVDEIVALH